MNCCPHIRDMGNISLGGRFESQRKGVCREENSVQCHLDVSLSSIDFDWFDQVR